MIDPMPAHVDVRIAELGSVIDAVHLTNYQVGDRHAVVFVARSHPAFARLYDIATRKLAPHAWGERDDGIALALPQATADKIMKTAGIEASDTAPADRITVIVLDRGAFGTVLRMSPVGGGVA